MLTKRTFSSTEEALKELQKGSESSILFENEMLNAGESIRRHANSLERWVIFNKGMGQCMIIMSNRRMLIRLSMEEVVAVCVSAGRAYALFSEACIFYKVLEVEK